MPRLRAVRIAQAPVRTFSPVQVVGDREARSVAAGGQIQAEDSATVHTGHDRTSVRLCVVDAGTNSFHALIADVLPDGTFTPVDRLKVMVRFGEHGLVEGRLRVTSIERGLDALGRIRTLAESHGVEEYLAFATSAIREVENGGELIARALQNHGISIRQITPEFEAELIYKAVRSVKDLREPAIIVDIGGGSAEFIVGTDDACVFRTSLPLGAGRLSRQFVTTDPVAEAEVDAIRAHCRDRLDPVVDAVRRHGASRLIGSSGTIGSLVRAALPDSGSDSASLYENVVRAVVLRPSLRRIIAANRSERETMPGIDRERIDQIVAGAVLLEVILDGFGIEEVAVSPHALREGMVRHFAEQRLRP